MKKLLLTLFVSIVAVTSGWSMMLPEDTIGGAVWRSWDEKEKTVFLVGFRLGSGSPVLSVPATTDKKLVMSQADFPLILKRVDSLYADKANETMTIRGAIEVALMEIRGASSESVAKKLELERTRISWGF